MGHNHEVKLRTIEECNCLSYESQLKVYEEQLKEKDTVIAELKDVIKTLAKNMR